MKSIDRRKLKECIIPNLIWRVALSMKNRLSLIKRRWQCKRTIVRCQQQHLNAIRKLENKAHINCVFFATYESVWKYDTLYRLMEKSDRFNPIILVCPVVNRGKRHMIESMQQCYDSFKVKGYKVILSYDLKNDAYLDVREELEPDIILYTNPYKGLIDDRYYIYQFQDVLTVYVSYNFGNSLDYNVFFNLNFHNLLWRYYLETPLHLQYSRTYADNKGQNAIVTGYLGIENLINPSYKITCDCWKIHDCNVKRIIWAPHHTLEPVGIVYYSCFLKYCNFMIKMAQKYMDRVQIAFKPHPLLRSKLDELWGEEKTQLYFRQWIDMPNTVLVEGEYIDLFLSSDAMIHDSGSFLVEYLYVNKPVMRTMNDTNPKSLFNDFALECLNQHYLAYDESDIEKFIQNVIDGVDPLREQRTQFVNDVLIPKGGMPSENIINDIIDSIENQRV